MCNKESTSTKALNSRPEIQNISGQQTQFLQNDVFVSGWIENSVGKEKMLETIIFFLSNNVFNSLISQGCWKSRSCSKMSTFYLQTL